MIQNINNNGNKKTIILVKDNDHNLHQYKFHEFNSDGYDLVIINYNGILNYLLSNNINEINIKNIEMIILIIPTDYHLINNLSAIVKDIKSRIDGCLQC
jgi:hypothetical protein